MSIVSDIRDAIASKIDSVPETGKVHSFERYAKNDRDIEKFFVWPGNDPDRNHLRGWQVRLQSTTELVKTQPAVTLVTYRWRVVALMGQIDAWKSGRIFDELIVAVQDAFRRDRSLGGLIEDGKPENQGGLQLTDNGGNMVAGHLCHVAELQLETAIEVDGSPTQKLDDYLTTETVFKLPALPEEQRLPVATDQQDMRAESGAQT